MNHNDFFRKIRYSLQLSDAQMLELFQLSGITLTPAQLQVIFKKEDDYGYVEASPHLVTAFLDGLIVKNRGRREEKPDQPKRPDEPLNNNTILKKIRIALELREENLIEVFKKAGVFISAGELSAFFRAPGHRNFKPLGDQYLRKFVDALITMHSDR